MYCVCIISFFFSLLLFYLFVVVFIVAVVAVFRSLFFWGICMRLKVYTKEDTQAVTQGFPCRVPRLSLIYVVVFFFFVKTT